MFIEQFPGTGGVVVNKSDRKIIALWNLHSRGRRGIINTEHSKYVNYLHR